MEDCPQPPLDPPDEPRGLECRVCGLRDHEIRQCCECNLMLCDDCLLKHVVADHRQLVLEVMSDGVTEQDLAEARAADEADRRYHEED